MAERISPDNLSIMPLYWQHRVVYEYTALMAKGKDVLDAGCGEGYGASILAKTAKSVLGIDKSIKVIKGASYKYQNSNLRYQVMDIEKQLPLKEESFDLICCFQVIEHLRRPELVLSEFNRILKTDGMLFLSTPNKLMSIIDNPYHFREYTHEELAIILEDIFPNVTLYSLHFSTKMKEFRHIRARTSKRIMRLDPFKLRRFIPRFLIQRAFDIVAQFFSNRINDTNAELIHSIDLNDFQISSDNLETGLDLIAICKK